MVSIWDKFWWFLKADLLLQKHFSLILVIEIHTGILEKERDIFLYDMLG